MGHSYTSNLIHLVFSTKDRTDIIRDELQPKLWAYMVGIGQNHGIELLATGGFNNHAHTLLSLPASMPLSKAVQTLKATSSRWMGEHGVRFAWQEGFGAFSVSPTHVPRVKAYIHGQAEHHRKRTFEEEFVEMLHLAGIEYDPRYVFG
jgi:putative transposase